MSDISRGEGWWQASDHKWYPPEQHPDFPAPTEPDFAPPTEPPVPEPVAASTSTRKWIIAFGVLAVAALALGTVLFFGGDDGNRSIAAASSTSPSSSSASSSSTPVALSEAELHSRLITAKDLGSEFADGSFVRSTAGTTPCGTQNPDRSIPPSIDVGSTAKTATGISFQQEIAVYDDETTANRAFDLDVGAYSCPRGTIPNSSSSDTLVFEPAQDHASLFRVDKAVEVDFQSNGFHGQLFFARTNATVVLIAFISLDTADTSGTRSSLAVTQEALNRLT